MPRQWLSINPNDIYSVTLTFRACAEYIDRKSSDIPEFNQSHNAAMSSSKCKTFALQVRNT